MGQKSRTKWDRRARALKRGLRPQLAQTIKRQDKLVQAVARG